MRNLRTLAVLSLLALLALPIAGQTSFPSPAPLGGKSEPIFVTPEHQPLVLELKFAHRLNIRLASGRFEDPAGRNPQI